MDDVIDFCKYASRNEWGPAIDCDHPKGSGHCVGEKDCKLDHKSNGVDN